MKINADRSVVEAYNLDVRLENLIREPQKPADFENQKAELEKQINAQEKLTKQIVDALNQKIAGTLNPVETPVAPVVPIEVQEKNTKKVLEAVNTKISLPKRWYDRLQKFVLEVSVNVGESILNDPNKLINLREKLGTIYGRLGDLRKQAKNAYEISLLNDFAGKTNDNKQNIDLYLRNLKSIDAQLDELKKDTSTGALRRVNGKRNR